MMMMMGAHDDAAHHDEGLFYRLLVVGLASVGWLVIVVCLLVVGLLKKGSLMPTNLHAARRPEKKHWRRTGELLENRCGIAGESPDNRWTIAG